jgi:adenylate cyclase
MRTASGSPDRQRCDRPPGNAAASVRAEAARGLIEWLLREGRFLPNNAELFSQFCERVVAAGIALDRASLHLRALHHRYRGVSRIWRPGEELDQRFLDHGIEKTAIYRDSPIRAVVEGKARLEWRLDDEAPLPFPILDELRAEGYTHYVIVPLVYASGEINAFSWATRQPGGFDPADLAFLEDMVPGFAAMVEVKALRNFVGNMLTTYVGRGPGRLILDGQVRRGDILTITAALMLIDLRDFTLLSDNLSPRAVIRLLDEYFDSVFPPVREHGGEILEIMGDGVLAIFQQPPGGSAAEACRAALAAAEEALAAVAERNRRDRPGAPVLQAGVALHYGTVSYGNIGSGDRLDFTVIGPDVNLTSRIEHFCRELDRSLIMSQAFAESLDRPVWELGHFELRGFSKLQRLFELPPEEG